MLGERLGGNANKANPSTGLTVAQLASDSEPYEARGVRGMGTTLNPYPFSFKRHPSRAAYFAARVKGSPAPHTSGIPLSPALVIASGRKPTSAKQSTNPILIVIASVVSSDTHTRGNPQTGDASHTNPEFPFPRRARSLNLLPPARGRYGRGGKQTILFKRPPPSSLRASCRQTHIRAAIHKPVR